MQYTDETLQDIEDRHQEFLEQVQEEQLSNEDEETRSITR